MKMTIREMREAVDGLTIAINAERPNMTAKAAYRLGLWRRKMLSAYEAAGEIIQKKIREYDYRAPIWTVDTSAPIPPGSTVRPMKEGGLEENYSVPPEKKIEHQQWWKEFSSADADVDVRPAPLSLFLPKKKGDPFTLTSSEIVLMGELLEDDLPDDVVFLEEGEKIAA